MGYTNKDAQKRLEREGNRNKALAVWESLNSHVTGATAGTVVAKLPAVGETRVVSWVQTQWRPNPFPRQHLMFLILEKTDMNQRY